MSMSKVRKEAQDKLRKKYKYSTNTNYNRGVVLSRLGDEEGVLFTDINILMNNIIRRENKEIYFIISENRDLGKDKPECERWINLNNCDFHMTFEELELIYTVAKAMRDENDWPAQEKELKKRRKENERKNNQ